MPTCVNINGTILAPDQAMISVFDHGFLFGDSVYEAFRTYGRKPFLFKRHHDRLEISARGTYLELPWTLEHTRAEVLRTLEAANNPGDSKVRLIVTRGTGDVNASPESCVDPKLIIIVEPLPDFPAKMYSEGVEMTVSSVTRGGMVAAYKTGNLIHQVLASREARERGAYDAILLTTDGFMSDGIGCNVYMVQGSTIKTPGSEAAIIEGITKAAVVLIARDLGLELQQGLFKPDEIYRSDEMFFTSSYREVVPVVRVDGKPIGNGKPGPWTTKILAAYHDAVEKLIAED